MVGFGVQTVNVNDDDRRLGNSAAVGIPREERIDKGVLAP